MGATLICGQEGTEGPALAALRAELGLAAVGNARYQIYRPNGVVIVYFDFAVSEGRLYLHGQDSFESDVNGWTSDHYFFGTAERQSADQLLRFAREWARAVLMRDKHPRIYGTRSYDQLRRDIHAELSAQPAGVLAPDQIVRILHGTGTSTTPTTIGVVGV
jgi:hypothetical protein